VIGHGAFLVAGSGLLVAPLTPAAGRDLRKIGATGKSEILTKPCRSAFMQLGRSIVI